MHWQPYNLVNSTSWSPQSYTYTIPSSVSGLNDVQSSESTSGSLYVNCFAWNTSSAFLYVDRLTMGITHNGTVKELAEYKADVIEHTDYYAFGNYMNARSNPLNPLAGEASRAHMNGQERDFEQSPNLYAAEYWEYDARIGRRWNTDPVTYPHQSPYAVFNNNPIYFSDPSGLEGTNDRNGNDTRQRTAPGAAPITYYTMRDIASHEQQLDEVTIRPYSWTPDERSAAQQNAPQSVTTNAGAVASYRVIINLRNNNYNQNLANQGSQVLNSSLLISIPLEEAPTGVTQVIGGAIIAGGTITAGIMLETAGQRDIPIDITDIVTGDNADNNQQETKVYEIYGLDAGNGWKWTTLKFGVASQKYDTYGGESNRRPDQQLSDLRAKYPNLLVSQRTLYYAKSKTEAHAIETLFVAAFAALHGYLPPEQLLPRPK